MGLWDRFFGRAPEPLPRTVTRGDDVALFEGERGPSLQMALARRGWNSRVFRSHGAATWEALARNLPVALVLCSTDADAVAEASRDVPAVREVPLVVLGEAPLRADALRVPADDVDALIEALDRLRSR